MEKVRPGIWCRLIFLLFLLLWSPSSWAISRPTTEEYWDAGRRLADSPLQVRSVEKAGLLTAEVAGQIDFPFARIRGMLTRPDSWCEFLPLVFNVKSCTFAEKNGRTLLTVYVGRKFYESPQQAIQLKYLFRVQEEAKDRFRIVLSAPEGPAGTRDYRIELAAVPTADGRTSIRMHSSFRPSLRSKLATEAYLATSGREKVGFSVRGYERGEPLYVGGVKGVVERNAMRYYLALKAFLDTLPVPAEQRFEARLQAWYWLTEKYPRQLYEMDRQEYLDAKRQERRNQLEMQGSLDDLKERIARFDPDRDRDKIGKLTTSENREAGLWQFSQGKPEPVRDRK